MQVVVPTLHAQDKKFNSRPVILTRKRGLAPSTPAEENGSTKENITSVLGRSESSQFTVLRKIAILLPQTPDVPQRGNSNCRYTPQWRFASPRPQTASAGLFTQCSQRPLWRIQKQKNLKASGARRVEQPQRPPRSPRERPISSPRIISGGSTYPLTSFPSSLFSLFPCFNDGTQCVVGRYRL